MHSFTTQTTVNRVVEEEDSLTLSMDEDDHTQSMSFFLASRVENYKAFATNPILVAAGKAFNIGPVYGDKEYYSTAIDRFFVGQDVSCNFLLLSGKWKRFTGVVVKVLKDQMPRVKVHFEDGTEFWYDKTTLHKLIV